jgi:hypothetical protein
VLGTQETFCIVIAGLLERDSFDLFLPEFDKPWVIHLRETCCCSTNLCTWRPNTVYKNRRVRRHQRTTAWVREESRIKSISAHPSDDEEDFVQETPEAELVAAQAYLLTTQPEPGDPRERMHQATIRSLGLVKDRLRKHHPEKKVTYHKEMRKESFKRQPSPSETSESSGDEKRRAWKEDARNIITQARVNNARYTWKEENYEDDEKEMGALCFT